MDWTSGAQSPVRWQVSDLCLAPEQPSQHLHEAVINSFPTAYTCKVTFLRSRQRLDRNKYIMLKVRLQCPVFSCQVWKSNRFCITALHYWLKNLTVPLFHPSKRWKAIVTDLHLFSRLSTFPVLIILYTLYFTLLQLMVKNQRMHCKGVPDPRTVKESQVHWTVLFMTGLIDEWLI